MFAWSVVVCHLFCQSLPLGRKCLAKDALMPCQAVIRFNSHPENFCFIAPLLNVFLPRHRRPIVAPWLGRWAGNAKAATHVPARDCGLPRSVRGAVGPTGHANTFRVPRDKPTLPPLASGTHTPAANQGPPLNLAHSRRGGAAHGSSRHPNAVSFH